MSTLNVTDSLVYSHTLQDLYRLVGTSGWSIKKVKYDKRQDCFIASAKDSFGRELEKTGPDEEMATRNLVLAIQRQNHMRTAAQEKLSAWQVDWSEQMQPIAEAYAKAPVYEPKAAIAYKELADDSMRRAEFLRNRLQIEETNEAEPYLTYEKMLDDIYKRQHYTVSRANTDHPVWTPEQVIAHRIAHDILGHGVSGGGFGWSGKNRAVAAHMPLLSEGAQKALFTDGIAKAAYVNHYHHLGPQKIALFPKFYEPIQKIEGVHPNFQGIHPSQSLSPMPVPAIQSPALRAFGKFKVATVLRSPWLTHPETGERIIGQPGATLMSHATSTLKMTTPEVWAALDDNSAGKA